MPLMLVQLLYAHYQSTGDPMDKPEYTEAEKEILERIEELRAEAKMRLDRMEKLFEKFNNFDPNQTSGKY